MFVLRDPQHRAAREMRKAAERSRELAELCERYAESLLEGEAGGARAEELRRLTRSKLAEVKEAVSDCDEWRSRTTAAAAAA